jgi:hypothetical protein
MEPPEVPIPEVPSIAEATIVQHPESGRECLLVTTEEGEKLAFGFEVKGDMPGLEIVDPALWLTNGPRRFAAVEEANADDWLQAVVVHPVGAEWLSRIKEAHPEAHHSWFAQTEYEDGGEGGAG